MFGDKFADFEIFFEGFVVWTEEFVIWGALCMPPVWLSAVYPMDLSVLCVFFPQKIHSARFILSRGGHGVTWAGYIFDHRPSHSSTDTVWVTPPLSNLTSLPRTPFPTEKEKSFLSQEENPSTFKNKTHLITVFTRWFDRTLPNEFMNRRFSTSFPLAALNVTKIFTLPLRLFFTSPFGSSLRALVCWLEEIFT